MSRIPLVASAEDLPDAIQFAQRNPTARWFVAGRAATFQHVDDIPDDWAEKAPITASLQAPKVSDAEKKTIDADVANGHEENLPHAIVDPDNDGDDDLVASKDTDHDGAAYRKKLGLKADSAPAPGEEDDEDPEDDEDDGLTAAIDYEALVAAGYYRDYGIEDDYDNFDVDSEMPLTASGQVIIADAFTAEQRQQYAKSKIALPDGSFPIPNKRYLAKAIRAVGRASNNSKGTVRKHIVKRAKALGASYMLPDSYNGVTAATSIGSLTVNVDAVAIAKNLLRSQAGITAAADDREAKKAALRELVNPGKAEAPEGAIAAASVIKDVEHGFDEALHPRGKDGKFITKGGRVIADDGAGHRVEGTVEAIHAGLNGGAHIQIKTDQGHSIITTPNHIVNAPTALAHLGEASVPHANPQTATEHIDNAQFHINEANEHLASAERARSDTNITKHQKLAAEHMTAAKAHRDSATALVNGEAPKTETNEFALPTHSASDLKPGDTFVSHGTKVTVTEGPKPAGEDRFGTKLTSIKARREDTGTEGTMQFGPGGVVHGHETAPKVGDTVTEGGVHGEVMGISDGGKTLDIKTSPTKIERVHVGAEGTSSGDISFADFRKQNGGTGTYPEWRAEVRRRDIAEGDAKQALRDRVQQTAIERTRRISNANVAKEETTGVKGMSDEDLQGLVDKYGSDSRIGTRAKAELDSRPGTSLGRKRAAETMASKSGLAPAYQSKPRSMHLVTPLTPAEVKANTEQLHPGDTVKNSADQRLKVVSHTGDNVSVKLPSGVQAQVSRRSLTKVEPISSATLRLHPGTYRSQPGHTITGKDTKGRRVNVFVPGERADAEKSRDNIKAGRSAFEDAPATAPTKEHPAKILGPEGTYNSEKDVKANYPGRDDLPGATPATPKLKTTADYTNASKTEHAKSDAEVAKDMVSPDAFTRRQAAEVQTERSLAENKAGNHQEAVVEQLKRMGYSERTAKGARNLTSKDKATRIKVNSDGSFGLKVNRGDGVYSARNHSVDTSGDAHSVAQALHETGKAAPPVKPHKANASEDNVLQARKEVIRRGMSEDATSTNAKLEEERAKAGSGKV